MVLRGRLSRRFKILMNRTSVIYLLTGNQGVFINTFTVKGHVEALSTCNRSSPTTESAAAFTLFFARPPEL